MGEFFRSAGASPLIQLPAHHARHAPLRCADLISCCEALCHWRGTVEAVIQDGTVEPSASRTWTSSTCLATAGGSIVGAALVGKARVSGATEPRTRRCCLEAFKAARSWAPQAQRTCVSSRPPSSSMTAKSLRDLLFWTPGSRSLTPSPRWAPSGSTIREVSAKISAHPLSPPERLREFQGYDTFSVRATIEAVEPQKGKHAFGPLAARLPSTRRRSRFTRVIQMTSPPRSSSSPGSLQGAVPHAHRWRTCARSASKTKAEEGSKEKQRKPMRRKRKGKNTKDKNSKERKSHDKERHMRN